jgi:electron transfer flavoprotein beta subunit
MDIIVCIKQVPDTTEVKINPETNTLIREGVPSIINPFDENAIEAGLRLKEANGGRVIVITMGPPQAESALRQALAMGADEVFLITDRAFAGSDTLATSYALASAIKKINPQGNYLIICGKQAIDGDTAQVGPGIAEWLNLPQVTFAVKVETADEGKTLKVERLLEEVNEVVTCPLPALITVVKQINDPRPPSLKGMMRAKKAEIPKITAADMGADPARLGLNGSPTWVKTIFSPPHKEGGEKFTGTSDEVVSKLLEKLKKVQLV